MTLQNGRPVAASQLNQRIVQLSASTHSGERPIACRQGKRPRPTVRCPQFHFGNLNPAGESCRFQSQVVEVAQGPGRETVSTTLVAGKAGLVDDNRVETSAGCLDGSGGAGGTSDDDQDITGPVVFGVDGWRTSDERSVGGMGP